MRFSASLGLTLGTLVTANVLSHRVIPDAEAAVAVGTVGALAAVARAGDLTVDDVGLARRTWGAGLRWGGVAAGIVAVAYGVAALIPAARDVTAESGASWPQVLLRSLVLIPLLTVIPEEFAFRGVLWGLLRRESGRRVATVVSSVLFGLWHVFPALGGGAANDSVATVVGGGGLGVAVRVVGTVLFTGLAGVVFCELRARSGSLLAPILLHWAVNGLGEMWVQLS